MNDLPLPVRRLVLNNGITVVVAENPAVNLVSGRIFLKNAGGLWEFPHQAGLFNLLAAVMTKGTLSKTAAAIAEQVEARGASLGADAATDYFALGLKAIACDFFDILELLVEILRSPVFPEAEVALEKHHILQAIRAQREQPFQLAFAQLREAMYGSHPYGNSLLGTEQTLSGVDAELLRATHQLFFRPDRLVVSLAGRISLEDAVRWLESLLGDWRVPDRYLPLPPLPPIPYQPQTRVQSQDSQQAIVMLGYPAPAISHPDYPVLKLLSTYLGSGLSSRLFVELREKRGLAYDVSAFYPTRLAQSQFVVYLGTAPANATAAIAGLRGEIDRLAQTRLSSEDWQGARNKLLSQYALGKQTNSELAQLYGWYEALELGIEYDRTFQKEIAEISPERALSVAQSYFQEPYLSLVGTAEFVDCIG